MILLQFGRFFQKTVYNPSVGETKEVSLTTSFPMSLKRAGSYICQMVPINSISVEETLTKWMRLEIYMSAFCK